MLSKASFFEVDYCFNLTYKEQIERIKQQYNFDFCENPTTLNAKFELSENDTFRAPLFFVPSCETYVGNTLRCGLRYSTQVLINDNSLVLFSGYLVDLDSLKQHVIRKSNYYLDDGIKHAFYNVKWDNETPVKFRKKVIKQIVEGYLEAADSFSKSHYKHGLCNLDSLQLDSLNKRYQFGFSITTIPLPPKNINLVIESEELESIIEN